MDEKPEATVRLEHLNPTLQEIDETVVRSPWLRRDRFTGGYER